MTWLIVRLSYLHAAENLCKCVDLWPVGNDHSPLCESLLARQLSHSGLAMDPRLGISRDICFDNQNIAKGVTDLNLTLVILVKMKTTMRAGIIWKKRHLNFLG
jgi:hypothetical protein